jgi:DNA-binding transcriptional LysR family regulator
MELRHLRYFVAVAEELHFGRAAARLHMAQPPLSQQIKSLEGELGVVLFHRTKRHVELSEAGRLFLGEARATLSQAARAEQTVRDACLGIQGRLAVGFVTSACHTVLPTAVRAFRAAYPRIAISLREMTPAAQLAALARHEIDVGLLRPPVQEADIASETILVEPLVAALPHTHTLAGRATLPLRALASEPFILFPRQHGPGLVDVILSACREAGFTPAVAHEPNEMLSLLAHIAGGLGVSLVPVSLADFHTDSIAYRPLRGPGLGVELALVWLDGRESIVRDHFRQSLREAGRVCQTRHRRTLRRGHHRRQTCPCCSQMAR